MRNRFTNRTIVCGVLALSAFVSGLSAQPKPKSQKEVEALQPMFNAQTPDARIQAAENVLSKFADSEFKSIALYFIAASYEQKGDSDKMQVYAERTLEADPKNYSAMLMLARGIASKTRENDLDKEEKLTRSEKFANQALETIKDAPKPNPQLTDDQWAGAKKDLTSQAHEALGISAMVRKKYDVASTEFKAALDQSEKPDPATIVRLASAYNQGKKYDDAITALDKLNAMPDVNPTVKQFAQAERVRAMQGKGGGAAAPHAAAPPSQVEIKKP